MASSGKLDKWVKPSLLRELALPTFDLAEGLCGQTDPEMFFPDSNHSYAPKQAIEICNRCPVQLECLEWALTNDERYGIWGGTTAQERSRMKGVGRGSQGTNRGRPRKYKAIPLRQERR